MFFNMYLAIFSQLVETTCAVRERLIRLEKAGFFTPYFLFIYIKLHIL